MIATFTTAGVLLLVLVFVLGTVVLRRSRRRGLVKAALDYSPTTAHLFNSDDEAGGGGSLSRSSDSLSSEGQSGSTRRPSVRGAYAPGPPAPALAPAPVPVSVPVPREMQQQGAGTGFADARYAYGSAPSYYDPVRQQPRQQPQQQSPPQRQVRWQQQEEEEEEWPLPPADLPPPGGVRHPSALIPAYHRELTAFNVPFAATANPGKPLRFSVDSGLNAGKRASRRTSQVPLPPPRFAPKVSNTLWRVDESPEEVSTGDEDRRYRPRVLKVRRRFACSSCFARG